MTGVCARGFHCLCGAEGARGRAVFKSDVLSLESVNVSGVQSACQSNNSWSLRHHMGDSSQMLIMLPTVRSLGFKARASGFM